MLSRSSGNFGTERKRPAAMSSRIASPTSTSSCLRGFGSGQRDSHGIADSLREELLEGDAGLDDAVRRQPGLGDAEVERARRVASPRTAGWLRPLSPDRSPSARRSSASNPISSSISAVLERGGHHRADGVVLELPRPLGIDGAAVDADADRAVVRGSDVDQVGHLVPRRASAARGGTDGRGCSESCRRKGATFSASR